MSRRRFFGLVGCGFALLLLTGAGLWAQHGDNIDAFVAVALVEGAIYLFGLGLIRGSDSSRRSLVLVFIVAAAMRLTVVAAPPFLSSDIYRYVWDGRVLAAGGNPYRYIPNDPHLADLRDDLIFPRINRGNYAPTIYPPVAEAIFFTVTRIGESVTAMKVAMIAFEAIAVALLLPLLASTGLPRTRLIVYLWHPLPVWEFAGSGHIDAAVIVLVAFALWCRRQQNFLAPRERGKRGWLTGVALAGAALGKFYPAVIFPALWRPWDWRMPAAFAALIVAAYLPFLGVGWGVFGFLPRYMAEEGFASGGGFYLWSLARVVLPLASAPDIAYLAAAALMLAGIAASVALGNLDPVRGAALLAGLFTLLLSPHYPWYFVWLIVFACLVPSASLLWLTVASFLLYLVPVGSQLMRDRPRFIVETAIYVPFVALAAFDLWRCRHRKPGSNGEHAG